MLPFHPHSRRLLAVLAALLLLSLSALDPFPNIVAEHPNLFLVLRTAECSLCDDLRTSVMANLPAEVTFREFVVAEAELPRLLHRINLRYRAGLPTDAGTPIYLRFVGGTLRGAGWGLDNADWRIGFLPERNPVSIAAALRDPETAVGCSAHANGSRCVFG